MIEQFRGFASYQLFDMSVAFTANYFFSGGDVSFDNETFLVTDFVNLKINLAQSFRGVYRGRVYVCVHMGEYSYVYEYIRFYCVSKKSLQLVFISELLPFLV
jgi:hypothetical protein